MDGARSKRAWEKCELKSVDDVFVLPGQKSEDFLSTGVPSENLKRQCTTYYYILLIFWRWYPPGASHSPLRSFDASHRLSYEELHLHHPPKIKVGSTGVNFRED